MHGSLRLGDDFVSLFMQLTEHSLSPEIFRRWTAIGIIAGALERRVWAKVGPRRAYPNMYTLLVAPPGVGKNVIEEAYAIWLEAKEPGSNKPAFHVAPTNMTKASLIDELGKSGSTRLPPDGPPFEYNSLLIAAEEFPVLMPTYDVEYINVLNYIWNNPPQLKETRRTGTVREIIIPNPQINLLSGIQPGWISAVFPEEAWSTGFTSRIIMVYASETTSKDLFAEIDGQPEVYSAIIQRVEALSQLFGQFEFTSEAQRDIQTWDRAGGPPTPTHSKLEHYNRRRTLHLIKLSLLSAVARGQTGSIELVDVERARAWLLEVEALMPDIFRAMVGKSDHQVLEELYHYCASVYRISGLKPINEHQLWDFLKMRVPSEKIERLIQVAERSNMLTRYAGTNTYAPNARHEHRGVE